METKLIVHRTQLSYGEAEAAWLNSRSDTPVKDDVIFSVLISSPEAFSALLDELHAAVGTPDAFAEELRSEFPDSFFTENDLCVMFSDERSGSNRLTIKEQMIFEDTFCLTLQRERGLTMDMAYLFLFCPVEGKTAVRSRVRIEDVPFTW